MFKKFKYKKDFSKMKKFYENEDFQSTIDYANSILDYDENNLEVLKYKYNSLTNLKLYNEALVCVNKIIDLNLTGIALVNKGTTLCFLGEYEQGFKILDEVIEKCPEYEVAFLNKGNFLYNLGNLDELLKLSNRVLELYPNCSAAYDIKSLVYLKKEDFDTALKCAEDALFYDPKNEIAQERKEFILSILEDK